MNKPLSLVAVFFAACITQATFLEGVPALAAGDDTFWVYYCDSGAELQMNYANMGGEYSVTPKLKDGKRVGIIFLGLSEYPSTIEFFLLFGCLYFALL